MTDKKDQQTDQEVKTTGHSWDGIEELDNPLPRWWLWTFLVSIVWSLGYWVVMPAWPLISSYTEGTIGYSSRENLNIEMAAIEQSRAPIMNAMVEKSLGEIVADPDLLQFAVAGGRAAFALHCSQCHGSGAAGAPGYPNLNDDDWIWGGSLEDIHQSIRVGIRSDHDESRMNEMPGFIAWQMISMPEAFLLRDYVKALGPDGTKLAERDPEGRELYEDNCAICHGSEGEGDQLTGSPRLNDAIWLYGSSDEEIFEQIARPRHGVMPAWEGRLGEATLKQLATFVHSLGGGE